MIFMRNGRRLGFTSQDGTGDFNGVNLLPWPTTVPDGPPGAICVQRPACLDATPACMLPEPSAGWCKPSGPGTAVVAQEPPPLGTIMPNGKPYGGGPVSDYAATVVVVRPTAGAIPPPTVPPIPAPATNAMTDFLTGSLFGGIPNWILLAAGAGLLLFHGEGK